MTITAQDIQQRLERVLPTVQKPGRYVGGEMNQRIKDWDSVQTRVALAFPDIYDIGVPNLGLAIFYESLNDRPDTLAERAYLPWLDMEEAMRRNGIPAYALESKRSLADFDILAITLPYETLYTNSLNLLDLAGIPLESADRDENHPLVIAGGHATYNPEPMARFIDAFAIGEGEEVIHEIVDAHQTWKRSGASRQALLESLASIPGVYVPSLYEVSYHPDGTVERVTPLHPRVPAKVTKRIVPVLPPPPTRFIVPNIDVVHNRVSVEIMRGCTRCCRFCHAGMVNRPVRERPVEQIVSAIRTALQHTGYEEVALLSLSSSDYTKIVDLVDAVSREASENHLVVSLPSLRIESFSVDLMDKLKGVRQGGFTLAPEAATDRMRATINKPIAAEQLLETARAIYQRGYQTIKLYFMIGHPSETLEDVQAIADLCKAVLAEGRRIIGKRANLHAGVSTFVPKPHTPFQWAAQLGAEATDARLLRLRESIRADRRYGSSIGFRYHDGQPGIVEGLLSRGDRRVGPVIEAVWRAGGRFDGWREHFSYERWMAAAEQVFADQPVSVDWYTTREREQAEVLPWDHIDSGLDREWLWDDWQAALSEDEVDDCRWSPCYDCGVCPQLGTSIEIGPTGRTLLPLTVAGARPSRP